MSKLISVTDETYTELKSLADQGERTMTKTLSLIMSEWKLAVKFGKLPSQVAILDREKNKT